MKRFAPFTVLALSLATTVGDHHDQLPTTKGLLLDLDDRELEATFAFLKKSYGF